jgi:anaerobic ribonucleoside-triphosphate reductase
MEEIKREKNIKKVQEIIPDIELADILEIHPYCPDCGSNNVYGISRVVGYFSIIDNWNDSKRAELKRRQKGNYWHDEE